MYSPRMFLAYILKRCGSKVNEVPALPVSGAFWKKNNQVNLRDVLEDYPITAGASKFQKQHPNPPPKGCNMAIKCLWDSNHLGRIEIHKKTGRTVGHHQIFGYKESPVFEIIFDKDRYHESIPKEEIEKITVEKTGEILWLNPTKRDLARVTEISWLK